jgi:hypothetical protein
MRRRSHWLKLVALILVMICSLWLFYRPHLDRRFVGTWSWYDAKVWPPDKPDDATLVATLIFSGDGSGRAVSVRDSEELARLAWHIDGRGRFVLEMALTPRERLEAVADKFRAMFAGQSTGVNEDVWNIREQLEDRIVLQNVAAPGAYIILKRDLLRRIR